jgi:hypothetical protein
MNAIGTAILSLTLLFVVFGSRRLAAGAFLVSIVYLTQHQQVDLLGINLYALRFVELALLARLLVRSEINSFRPTIFDWLMPAQILYVTVVYCVFREDGIAFRIGSAIDSLICYFAVRTLITSTEDLLAFLRLSALILLPYAILVTYESFTGKNPFSVIGGRIGGPDMIRGDRMRAAGTFRHASLLGTLGATFLPLFAALLFDRTTRRTGIIGVCSAALIVFASNSGAPLSCALIALAGWAAWPLRRRLRLLQFAALALFVTLVSLMKAPVWYLVAKVSSITGGDGWHRSRLMEQAYNSMADWWAVGMPITKTRDWFPYFIEKTGAADITNLFVSYGLNGGLIAMGLLLTTLIVGFVQVGRGLRLARSINPTPVLQEKLLWSLGVVLLIHIFNWIGITYFDQSYALWCLHAGVLASLTAPYPLLLQTRIRQREKRQRAQSADPRSDTSVASV